MDLRSVMLRAGLVAVAVGVVFVGTGQAADGDELVIKARAISPMNITRGASDLLDIRVERWSTDEERAELVKSLESGGNQALADDLSEREPTGWVSFDPRGGGGPGRDPRRAIFRYAREIQFEDRKEVVLITNHYPGYGNDPQAADGAKLANYPVSFLLLKLYQDDDGEWTGKGRMFVGAKLRYDTSGGKFVIDEFPMDPVYIKDVKIK